MYNRSSGPYNRSHTELYNGVISPGAGSLIPASSLPQIVNPFSMINVEGEIPEFLEWVKTQVSESYYKKNIKVYAQYLRLLTNPLRFTQAMNLKTPKARTHMMKVVSNFARFLDMKYESTAFTEYYELLRKRLRIRWALEPEEMRRIPSLEELADIVGIAARTYVNYAMYLYLLAISGLRPSEVRHLEIRGPITPIHKNGNNSTKRAHYCFATPRYLQLASRLGLQKIELGSNKVYEAKKAIKSRYPWFTPYALRHFFATWMISRGMVETKVDFIQGRAPKTILRKHYLHLDGEAALRELYREYLQLIEPIDMQLGQAIESILLNTHMH